ncbi:hypothetical protein [Spirosoma pollinicola]|uniref:Uncharacterized protein n=1 Tax=Spirosoma pollinicola TaxID=2057025 RepID=A0A2K8YTG9_9BACT|nr:hypothetical protein [Spirosoma pollinicola]AUD00932.1 hypothetical protein CWM47_03340 [Spirosoma pollinicola]
MQSFDERVAEKQELDVLIERGMRFSVPKRSLLRYIGKPDRSFLLQQPYLGTLDRLSAEFIHLDLSEERLAADWLSETKHLTRAHVTRCARIVAMAILNSQWRIRLCTGLLSRYLLWHLTPQTLLRLVLVINSLSNIGDFINSIRLMSAKERTTMPVRIETPAKPRA